MLRRPLLIAAIAVVAAGAAFWLMTAPLAIPPGTFGPHTPDLANGRTMFLAGGCASCHAMPGQTDSGNLAGGLGLKTGFGTFYAPNVSQHRDDGIGGWSEEMFVSAMVYGASPQGRHYYPAFPYPSYRRMTVSDLRDLFAYMKTLPAVPGRVRDHEVPFPFNMRILIGGWKLMALGPQGFAADTARPAPWNRGAYLVEGPGHCAECHSPRNALGIVVEAQRFAGGPEPAGDGFVPNITQARLGDWSVSDIAYLLETGSMPDGDTVGGSMAAVIRNTAQLPEADRNAMAVYLKSLAPVEGPARPPRRQPER